MRKFVCVATDSPRDPTYRAKAAFAEMAGMAMMHLTAEGPMKQTAVARENLLVEVNLIVPRVLKRAWMAVIRKTPREPPVDLRSLGIADANVKYKLFAIESVFNNEYSLEAREKLASPARLVAEQKGTGTVLILYIVDLAYNITHDTSEPEMYMDRIARYADGLESLVLFCVESVRFSDATTQLQQSMRTVYFRNQDEYETVLPKALTHQALFVEFPLVDMSPQNSEAAIGDAIVRAKSDAIINDIGKQWTSGGTSGSGALSDKRAFMVIFSSYTKLFVERMTQRGIDTSSTFVISSVDSTVTPMAREAAAAAKSIAAKGGLPLILLVDDGVLFQDTGLFKCLEDALGSCYTSLHVYFAQALTASMLYADIMLTVCSLSKIMCNIHISYVLTQRLDNEAMTQQRLEGAAVGGGGGSRQQGLINYRDAAGLSTLLENTMSLLESAGDTADGLRGIVDSAYQQVDGAEEIMFNDDLWSNVQYMGRIGSSVVHSGNEVERFIASVVYYMKHIRGDPFFVQMLAAAAVDLTLDKLSEKKKKSRFSFDSIIGGGGSESGGLIEVEDVTESYDAAQIELEHEAARNKAMTPEDSFINNTITLKQMMTLNYDATQRHKEAAEKKIAERAAIAAQALQDASDKLRAREESLVERITVIADKVLPENADEPISMFISETEQHGLEDLPSRDMVVREMHARKEKLLSETAQIKEAYQERLASIRETREAEVAKRVQEIETDDITAAVARAMVLLEKHKEYLNSEALPTLAHIAMASTEPAAAAAAAPAAVKKGFSEILTHALTGEEPAAAIDGNLNRMRQDNVYHRTMSEEARRAGRVAAISYMNNEIKPALERDWDALVAEALEGIESRDAMLIEDLTAKMQDIVGNYSGEIEHSFGRYVDDVNETGQAFLYEGVVPKPEEGPIATSVGSGSGLGEEQQLLEGPPPPAADKSKKKIQEQQLLHRDKALVETFLKLNISPAQFVPFDLHPMLKSILFHACYKVVMPAAAAAAAKRSDAETRVLHKFKPGKLLMKAARKKSVACAPRLALEDLVKIVGQWAHRVEKYFEKQASKYYKHIKVDSDNVKSLSECYISRMVIFASRSDATSAFVMQGPDDPGAWTDFATIMEQLNSSSSSSAAAAWLIGSTVKTSSDRDDVAPMLYGRLAEIKQGKSSVQGPYLTTTQLKAVIGDFAGYLSS